MTSSDKSQQTSSDGSRAMLTVGVVIVVINAALVGAVATSGLTDSAAEPYDAVPQAADVVVSVDPVGFAQDPVTTSAGNELLNATDANQTYQEALSAAFEQANGGLNTSLANYSLSDTGVEVQDVGEVVIFTDSETVDEASSGIGPGVGAGQTSQTTDSVLSQEDSGESPYVGAVIELDLSSDDVGDVFSAIEQQDTNGSVSVSTYKNAPILTFEGDEGEQPVAVANLGPALVGVGTPSVVEDIVDTHVGDADGIPEWMEPTVGGERYLGVAVANPSEAGLENVTGQAPGGAEYRYLTLAYGTANGDQARLRAEFEMEINESSATTSLELNADSAMIDYVIREAVGGFLNASGTGGVAEPPIEPTETGNRTAFSG